jgi:hypothetical protein
VDVNHYLGQHPGYHVEISMYRGEKP